MPCGRQPKGWAREHRWRPPRLRAWAGLLGPGALVETTEAEGLGRAELGVAGPPPQALGNARVPAAVHPKPNSPMPGREAACGQAHAPGRAHPQRCPPLRGGLLDACLPTPPAAASSPNTTPSPDPSALLGVPLEPRSRRFYGSHHHGCKSPQGTLMKASAVFPSPPSVVGETAELELKTHGCLETHHRPQRAAGLQTQGPGRQGGVRPLSLVEGHVRPPGGHPPTGFGDAWGLRATAAKVGQ